MKKVSRKQLRQEVTEKTVFVIEIEHDAACVKQHLRVMVENGAGSNVKAIKVLSIDGVNVCDQSNQGRSYE